MGNSIYDSSTIYKWFLELKLEKSYRRVVLRHIMSILLTVFTIGYKGKTVHMGKNGSVTRGLKREEEGGKIKWQQ